MISNIRILCNNVYNINISRCNNQNIKPINNINASKEEEEEEEEKEEEGKTPFGQILDTRQIDNTANN